MARDVITREEVGMLREIFQLLEEANQHSLKMDGHCKSSEGMVELNFGNHWDRMDEDRNHPPSVYIYSYLLAAEGRHHHFQDIEHALEVVKEWHEEEMSREDDCQE